MVALPSWPAPTIREPGPATHAGQCRGTVNAKKKRRKVRRRPAAPTIGDVAREAGVSPMTVSRVINGESTVRAASRAAVEVAIAAPGYAPNEAARHLAGATQIRIAMLYCRPSAYISEFLFGGLEQARKSNAQILVEKCEDDKDAAAELHRMAASDIDGVLLPPPLGDARRVLDEAEAIGLPAVVVSSAQTRDNVSAVSVDDYRAARAMTDHILSLGHRRIGFIAGDPHQLASAHRLEGYRSALAAAGIAAVDALIAPGMFTYRSGLDAAETLLALPERPTAIFASNDAMAAATVAVAHMRGLDVPGDLTVCGFDDTAFAVTIWPELTTIRQPIADLSRAAAELLVQKIRAKRSGGSQKSQHVKLEFSLVRRQSDAAPRSRPGQWP